LRIKTIHTAIIVLILFCGYTQKTAFSQKLKDTLNLPEIEIKFSYSVKNYGFKKETIDSALLIPHLDADLSTILSKYSPIFVKSYGNGSLATTSFRGTSANHTEVEWNGISINSPMLGQSDLSQVPVSQFDGIEVLYGAAGLAKTIGAFGGVVNLVSTPEWNNRVNLTFSQTMASFNTFTTVANIGLGNSNFQSVTKLNYSSSANDFPYYNDYTLEHERQRNGAYDVGGITQELFFRLGKKNFLSGRAWYSQDVRDIPPVTTNQDPNYVATQKDRALRTLIEWILLNPKSALTVRTAFVDQFMNYKDNSFDDNHQNYAWITKIRYNYSGIRNLSIKPGIDFTYDWVYSDAYKGVKTRSTLGMSSEFYYDVRRNVELLLIVRQDLIDGKAVPFVPAIGVDWRPFTKVNLSLAANFSKNYRYPTLNDLYWDVSGNPDLIPETDYAGELGLTYNYNNPKGTFFIESQVSGFYNKMINLIVWTPVGGGSLWTPANESEVLSRGFDLGLNVSWNVSRVKLSFNNNYTYCRSTYEKATTPTDASVGNQVIYIPVNLFNSTLVAEYRGFSLSYNFNWVSRRYTSRDNLSYMPGYNLSNIFLGKNIKFSNIVVSLQLQINNLFGLDYQSIENHPMPGRNYGLTIRFNFKK
jgi:outer membrane cobalamin receptor